MIKNTCAQGGETKESSHGKKKKINTWNQE